jgi:hypothetical protein
MPRTAGHPGERRDFRAHPILKTNYYLYRNARLDLGKMNLQLVANEENQDRAQGGKNEASRMISFVGRARKHVGNAPADDRADNAEHNRPEDCDVFVHHRLREHARD